MTFLIDAQTLKPGLILFRRADVKHRNWYCRIRVPRSDRYKTVSLKTADVQSATELAFDADADLRFRVKHGVPVFNRSFAQVAKAYAEHQKARSEAGEISHHRWEVVESIIRAQLNRYVGPKQIAHVSHDDFLGYPLWRRQNGEGRGGRKVSDATIRYEMAIFRSVVGFAVAKRWVPESHLFKGRLPLAKVRREEFTPDEYRKLHTFARGWVKRAKTQVSRTARQVAYNFILIMCNTGMRPAEAKNLQWRDVSIRADGEGRKFVVLNVRGKDKARQLVAAGNVANYLERVRSLTNKGTAPEGAVFVNSQGTPAATLYADHVENLLREAGLLQSASGSIRSTYCFRHTYATFRLTEGVDVYFLSKQMGTSVKMIEDHYGHINPVRNAGRILQGLPGWNAV
jgi:integrase